MVILKMVNFYIIEADSRHHSQTGEGEERDGLISTPCKSRKIWVFSLKVGLEKVPGFAFDGLDELKGLLDLFLGALNHEADPALGSRDAACRVQVGVDARQ